MHFREHLLSYTLIPLFIISIIFSFFRFIVSNDYIVAYEVMCNPETQSCFVGCEDDECTEEYYYARIQKHAADLYVQCGKNIENCVAANTCLPDDRECVITYCDAESDGAACEALTEDPNEVENELEKSGEEIMM